MYSRKSKLFAIKLVSILLVQVFVVTSHVYGLAVQTGLRGETGAALSGAMAAAPVAVVEELSFSEQTGEFTDLIFQVMGKQRELGFTDQEILELGKIASIIFTPEDIEANVICFIEILREKVFKSFLNEAKTGEAGAKAATVKLFKPGNEQEVANFEFAVNILSQLAVIFKAEKYSVASGTLLTDLNFLVTGIKETVVSDNRACQKLKILASRALLRVTDPEIDFPEPQGEIGTYHGDTDGDEAVARELEGRIDAPEREEGDPNGIDGLRARLTEPVFMQFTRLIAEEGRAKEAAANSTEIRECRDTFVVIALKLELEKTTDPYLRLLLVNVLGNMLSPNERGISLDERGRNIAVFTLLEILRNQIEIPNVRQQAARLLMENFIIQNPATNITQEIFRILQNNEPDPQIIRMIIENFRQINNNRFIQIIALRMLDDMNFDINKYGLEILRGNRRDIVILRLIIALRDPSVRTTLLDNMRAVNDLPLVQNKFLRLLNIPIVVARHDAVYVLQGNFNPNVLTGLIQALSTEVSPEVINLLVDDIGLALTRVQEQGMRLKLIQALLGKINDERFKNRIIEILKPIKDAPDVKAILVVLEKSVQVQIYGMPLELSSLRENFEKMIQDESRVVELTELFVSARYELLTPVQQGQLIAFLHKNNSRSDIIGKLILAAMGNLALLDRVLNVLNGKNIILINLFISLTEARHDTPSGLKVLEYIFRLQLENADIQKLFKIMLTTRDATLKTRLVQGFGSLCRINEHVTANAIGLLSAPERENRNLGLDILANNMRPDILQIICDRLKVETEDALKIKIINILGNVLIYGQVVNVLFEILLQGAVSPVVREAIISAIESSKRLPGIRASIDKLFPQLFIHLNPAELVRICLFDPRERVEQLRVEEEQKKRAEEEQRRFADIERQKGEISGLLKGGISAEEIKAIGEHDSALVDIVVGEQQQRRQEELGRLLARLGRGGRDASQGSGGFIGGGFSPSYLKSKSSEVSYGLGANPKAGIVGSVFSVNEVVRGVIEKLSTLQGSPALVALRANVSATPVQLPLGEIVRRVLSSLSNIQIQYTNSLGQVAMHVRERERIIVYVNDNFNPAKAKNADERKALELINLNEVFHEIVEANLIEFGINTHDMAENSQERFFAEKEVVKIQLSILASMLGVKGLAGIRDAYRYVEANKDVIWLGHVLEGQGQNCFVFDETLSALIERLKAALHDATGSSEILVPEQTTVAIGAIETMDGEWKTACATMAQA